MSSLIHQWEETGQRSADKEIFDGPFLVVFKRESVPKYDVLTKEGASLNCKVQFNEIRDLGNKVFAHLSVLK